MSALFVVPQVSEDFVHCSFNLFSLLFKLRKVYYSVLKFTDFILCHLYSTIHPSSEMFYSSYFIFQFYNFHFVLFYNFNFLLTFDIFSFVSREFITAIRQLL